MAHQKITTDSGEVLVPKKKGTSLLLCVFAGCWGLHKFYEGNIIMGLLYIFTQGFGYIGILIDIIALIRKPSVYYLPSVWDRAPFGWIKAFAEGFMEGLRGEPKEAIEAEVPAKLESPTPAAKSLAIENTGTEDIPLEPAAPEEPEPEPIPEPEQQNETVQNAEANVPVRKLPRNVKSMPELITGPLDKLYRRSSISGNTAMYYCPTTGHMVTIQNRDIGPNGTSATVNGEHYYW